MSSPTSELIQKYFDADLGQIRSTMIRAGAGAGKTTELIRRVISIALTFKKEKNEWPRLVVTTFTRKATQELRERLVAAALSLQDQTVQTQMHAQFGNLDIVGLLNYVQSSQSLHISTLHGTLAIFLRRYGQSIRLSPDFSFLDQRQMDKLYRQALNEVVKDPSSAEQYVQLREQVNSNKLQKSIYDFDIAMTEHPELTEIDTEDLKKVRLEKLNELSFLISFLAQDLDNYKLSDTWQRRHIGIGKLKNYFLKKDFSFNSILLQELDDFIESKGAGALKNKAIDVATIEKAQKAYDIVKELSDPLWLDESLKLIKLTQNNFSKFATKINNKIYDQKIKNSKISMEDLEIFSLRLINAFPDTANKFSQEWDLWLIDEYQDTSPRQVKLIEALTSGRPKFLVGDPQQSIYLFRGARSEVFFNALDTMKESSAEIKELMTNYRTAAPVLEFMNDLFTKASSQLSPMRIGSKLKIDNQNKHISLIKTEEKNRKEGLQVKATVQEVLRLKSAGISDEQICILCRKKRDLKKIASELQKIAISVQLHTSGEFYSRREVRDALLILKFLINPFDNINLIALLRSPWLPATDDEILKICDRKAISFWPILNKLVDEDTSIGKSAKILEQFQRTSKVEGCSRAWRKFLIEQGLFLSAKQLDPSGRREANLWKLVHLLFSEQVKPGFQIINFIQNRDVIDLEEQSDGDANPVIEPKRIQLMTVHASKGLQFPYVIVPYMNDKDTKLERRFFAYSEQAKKWGLCLNDSETGEMMVLPELELIFQDEKNRSALELDRVFYVALTRAQMGLSLIWAPKDNNQWVGALDSFESLKTDFNSDEMIEYATKSNEIVFTPARILLSENSKSVAVPSISVTRIVDILSQNKSLDYSKNNFVSKSLDAEIKRTQEIIKQNPSAENSWSKLEKAHLGTRMHFLFESLKSKRSHLVSVSKEEKQAMVFLQTEQAKFVLDVIQSGEVEWGFHCRFENQHSQVLIQGQIDLWGYDQSGQLWIVDYKTGSTAYSDKAFLQMQIYAWAIRKVLNLNNDIQLAAVFPLDQEVLIQGALSNEQIEKQILTSSVKFLIDK